MMDDMTSARLAMPLLQAGQAQKEIAHNEALALLDCAVGASVVSLLDVPPANPTIGQCWLVGDAPIGDWAAKAGALAGWTAGGWRFVMLPIGARVWSDSDQADWRRMPDGWTQGDLRGSRVLLGGEAVLGPQRPAISDPAGGTIVDDEARKTVAAVLAALRAHGLIAT